MRIVADLLRQKGDIARERDEALARVAALEAALGVSCDRLGSLRPGDECLSPERTQQLDLALMDVQRQIRAALSAPGATSPEHAATTTADFDPVRAENFGLRARLTAAVKILAEHGLALGQADFDQARAALAAHDAEARAAALREAAKVARTMEYPDIPTQEDANLYDAMAGRIADALDDLAAGKDGLSDIRALPLPGDEQAGEKA